MSDTIFTRAISTLTLLSYASLLVPVTALAQQEPIEVELTEGQGDRSAYSREVWSAQDAVDPNAAGDDAKGDEAAQEAGNYAVAESDRPLESRALPTGEAKSAVTPQAISLPNAEGSVEGMGESFTPNLSAGTGAFSVPIELPPGRAGAQPTLALSYSTSAGNGVAGFGWDLAYPFIARQTDKGLPRYVDSANGLWHEQEDRFVYNGGQELVPVDSAEASAVDGAPVPSDLQGFQQYRARVEGAFMRFFRAPSGLSWVVQDKSGMRLDFGLLETGDGPAQAIAASSAALLSEQPGGQGRIFSWALTRSSDAHGSTIYFQYRTDDGQRYLADVNYVSPAGCANDSATEQRECALPLSDYGRRVHLVYESREDAFDSYTTTWRVTSGLRLSRVEVTAAESDATSRSLVRRYHLRYDPLSFLSLLTELQVEGRPETFSTRSQVPVGDRYVPEASLGSAIVGRALPVMRFGYTSPSATSPAVEGFSGIDARVHVSAASPPHSVDEARSDLFDVNSDGLPDVIVTDPATYRTDNDEPAVGVFFNGFSGADGAPAGAGQFSEAIAMELPAGFSSVMQLGNTNITPMDVDGDGRSDLLHMPRVADYGYFTPTRAAEEVIAEVSPTDQRWRFARVPVQLASGEIDPRIDFGRDASFIKTFDVDNDHLIDVVRTTGSVMQTWLNLGRYPGGDGLFGSALFDGDEWQLSTEPLESCLLQEGQPLDFEDAEIRLADMNGDGIQDIVDLRRGHAAYWPGRGPGLWGDGLATCARGEGEGRVVDMYNAPDEVNPELDGVFLSDVNHDGADDIVQVRFDAIDVWFNRAGHGFSERTTAIDTPYAPAFAPTVRLVDIDGSGTIDVLYAQGDDYRWIDPMGGQKPRLLQLIDNGIGALTELEYASSTDDYLRDLAQAQACVDSSCERYTWSSMRGQCDQKIEAAGEGCVHRSGGSPVVSTVVRSTITRDQLDQLGREENAKRIEYAYHDAYYEGIEQEFRGFGAAEALAVGAPGQPSSITRTHFNQGRRDAEIASDRLADNPNEALKGRAYLTEVLDTNGTYVSTSHEAFTAREILRGQNDVSVVYAFVQRTDQLRYDTAPFTASAGSVLSDPLNASSSDFVAVRRETAGAGLDAHAATPGEAIERRQIQLRGAGYAHVVSTVDDADNAGNLKQQTAHGRARGEFAELLAGEAIVTHTIPTRVDPNAHGQWLWRTAESFVTGHGDAGQRLAHSIHTFNATGDLRLVQQPVTLAAGTPAYEFGGDTAGAASYPFAPESALISTAFDSWGNGLRFCVGADLGEQGLNQTGCLRFREVSFDDAYQQFARFESTAVGGTTSSLALLTSEALWDQGLSSPLVAIDPNRLETQVEYDGLGRLASLTPPRTYGCASSVPLTRMTYDLAQAGRPINVITIDSEQSCSGVGADSLRMKVYLDGLGRKRAQVLEAEDPDDATVATRVQRSGMVTFHAKGGVREAFQSDVLDTEIDALGADTALSLPSSIPSTFTGYDAFDRPESVIAEDGAITRTRYHALSTDVWDPLDADRASHHYATPSTQRMDGHGRVIDSALRNRQGPGAALEIHRLFTSYRADNQVVSLTRAQTASDGERSASSIVSGHSTTRSFVFDSRGRRLGSFDPDTDDLAKPTSRRSWRYLFNRADDLVAVRDPRGCGQNFFYDRAGRLIGEDYVQCSEAQISGEQTVDTLPAGTIALSDTVAAGTAVDARYYFDDYPSWYDSGEGFDLVPTGANRILGRATASIDRAQRSVAAYDDRGNVIWQARQMAVIPNADALALTLSNPPQIDTTDAISARAVSYDRTTYVAEHSFDHAGRARAIRLPSDPDYAGTAPRIGGTVDYNARGLITRAALSIDNAVQSIVERIDYTRDSLPTRIEYGDTVSGEREATLSQVFYDVRRRPERAFTLREPTADRNADPINGRALGAVMLVSDQQLVWDAANNLVALHDLRDGSEWRRGFRPASYTVAHDALYRITNVEQDYTQDSGARTPSDSFVDYRSELAKVESDDPMRTDPAPMLPAEPSGRVASLTYEYDWLANMVDWTDDAAQFYERSLGRISNGANEAGDRPSALRLASNLPTTAPTTYSPSVDRGGYVELDYGTGGNVVMMTAHAQCHDRSGLICFDNGSLSVAARRTQLRSNCECEAEQSYHYRYDELNRVSDARRYDRPDGTGSWSLSTRQRYRYDSTNQRAVKLTMDISLDVLGEVEPSSSNERIALYAYPGDFERRGLTRDGDSYNASGLWDTETQYLVGGARVVIKNGGSRVLGELDRDLRITVALSDAIQSTTGVLDLISGSLVEVSTYYPNGARESYRAPDGPGDAIAAEPLGFTGKEADEEVGLVYFGERYLMAHLGRWATPDPLSVHAAGGGEVGNSYHYVSGNLLQARDPLGLVEIEVGITDSFNDALLTATQAMAGHMQSELDQHFGIATIKTDDWNGSDLDPDTEKMAQSHEAAISRMRDAGATDRDVEKWEVARTRLLSTVESSDEIDIDTTTDKGRKPLMLGEAIERQVYMNPFSWFDKNGNNVQGGSSPAANAQMGPTMVLLHELSHAKGCMSGTADCSANLANTFDVRRNTEQLTVDDVNAHTDAIPNMAGRPVYSVKGAGVPEGTLPLANGQSYTFPNAQQLTTGTGQPPPAPVAPPAAPVPQPAK